MGVFSGFSSVCPPVNDGTGPGAPATTRESSRAARTVKSSPPNCALRNELAEKTREISSRKWRNMTVFLRVTTANSPCSAPTSPDRKPSLRNVVSPPSQAVANDLLWRPNGLWTKVSDECGRMRKGSHKECRKPGEGRFGRFLVSRLPLAAHKAVCLAGASPVAGIGCLPA